MLIHEPVQAAIWHCLNHYSFADASFLAERLYHEAGSDEALFLLATCYYRSGKPARAYSLLQNAGCPTPQCRFLMAQCCLAINKLSEAETALTGHILQKNKQLDDIAEEFGESACFTMQLLGHIYSKTERAAKSTECYRKSLKQNPFLWSSFEALCKMGEKPDPAKTFQVHSETFANACPSNLTSPHIATLSPDFQAPGLDFIQHVPLKKPMTRRRIQQQTVVSGGGSSTSTTTSSGNSSSGSMQQQQHQQNKPPPLFSQSSSNTNASRDNVQTPQGLQSGNVPALRRSSRLFMNASSSVKENNKSQSQRKFSCPKAPVKKTKSRSSKTQQELNEINKGLELGGVTEIKPSPVADAQSEHIIAMQKHSADGLMQLLQLVGKAYVALCQYECSKALHLFEAIPPRHYNTGWVLCQVGRAHFEMADYQKAEKLFTEVRRCDPCQLDGMETYSTTLWHLQREVRLSTLAQELTQLDKDSPQAWCAAGNCFSLQKEHDVAIKFFQRAVQVDPDFAYAYTLLGHEYVLTEELDKALACFRNAIRVDPRHYNAWYGVGMVYYKQEKFSLAEVHFRRALSINTQSSVLLCHIGVVQHALKKSETALSTLNKAIATDPKNPLCKFHRASILFANDRHKEALKELEELKEIVPRESLVYFLIGKVHKKLGNTHLALMNFSWAMDLDPKGANNQIKEAIDKRYVNEEDDPSMGLGKLSPEMLEEELSSNNSSVMDADDAQLQAIESDESL